MNNPGTFVELCHGRIPTETISTFLRGDVFLGGLVTFDGVTRAEDAPAHGDLVRLEYEAYEGMALKELEKLAATARDRWSAGRVAIIHRLGPVLPGETSVTIGVACGHRAEAFEACHWIIDTLKKDVPIWKRTVYADGYFEWGK
ncbi:MAG: molybdenum cofactor biosynthesis protein MoaE [Planctomycetes bacterium]|nr:molybdenum cofactor biosynthesis protein MoaE [Planctomycetota bacterium]MBI3834041.1 molybdenum cofactor biosynthesis protein MoaE [Planctomycetota bacterium]